SKLSTGPIRLFVLVGGVAIAMLFFLSQNADLRLGRETVSALTTGLIAIAFGLCGLTFLGIAAALKALWSKQLLGKIADQTTRVTTMVFTILIGAALFSLVFRGLGGDETVRHALEATPGGLIGAIAAVMLVMFVLGFFLDFIEITLVVVPLVAPVLLGMGLDPVWLGVLMAVNLQTSFLTPPFGFALFYLRGVAPPEITTLQIYKGAVPFIAIQIFALVMLFIFPQLATWLPDQIYG
ncbi:MAG: TRAP transporter large permease subunit, partial [Pseudomonadota bacterium]